MWSEKKVAVHQIIDLKVKIMIEVKKRLDSWGKKLWVLDKQEIWSERMMGVKQLVDVNVKIRGEANWRFDLCRENNGFWTGDLRKRCVEQIVLGYLRNRGAWHKKKNCVLEDITKKAIRKEKKKKLFLGAIHNKTISMEQTISFLAWFYDLRVRSSER